MSPMIALLLGKILEYLADHVDDVVDLIKKEFLSAQSDPVVKTAVQEFAYNPDEDTLKNLHDVLVEKGEDPDKLAKIIVNSAEC